NPGPAVPGFFVAPAARSGRDDGRRTMDDASGGQGKNTQGWRLATRMVRGATQRSPYGETSEALFLNSGFTYENAEAAEARFKGEQPGFVYSRYENPTVRMFEQRMALIEGAEDARAT